MSPWGDVAGGPLLPEESEKILDYIRAWQTLPSDDIHDIVVDGSAENGAVLYALHCANCHGEQGEGATAMSLNHPIFLESVSDGFLLHAIQKGRSGTTMLSYDDLLTEQEMYDLIMFIRSLESL